jgi:hypothetical protein
VEWWQFTDFLRSSESSERGERQGTGKGVREQVVGVKKREAIGREYLGGKVSRPCNLRRSSDKGAASSLRSFATTRLPSGSYDEGAREGASFHCEIDSHGALRPSHLI